MNIKIYAFITSSPTLLLEEKGVVTPLSLGEGLGGEVTLSSLVKGYSICKTAYTNK